MTAVWEDPYFNGQCSLLIALAIADSARSEDGLAWPSVNFIARKSRTSERSVQGICRQFERDGKLEVQIGKGPHGTNLYRITPASVAPRSKDSHWTPPQPVRGAAGAGCKVDAPICTPPPADERTPFAPNPSVSVIQPSLTPPAVPEKEKRSGFSVFWTAYPKKKSKGDAEKAWKTMKCDRDTESIIDAISRAKESHDWIKDGGQWIPYPATWLRAKGWEDEAFIAPQPVVHFSPDVPRLNGSPTLRDQLQANLDYLADHGRLPTAAETDQVHTEWMATHPDAEGWEQ